MEIHAIRGVQDTGKQFSVATAKAVPKRVRRIGSLGTTTTITLFFCIMKHSFVALMHADGTVE